MLLCSGLALAAGFALSLTDVSIAPPWLHIIISLLVFILPGGYLFALVPVRESWDIIDFVGFGFTYSVALITLLGLITRTFALSIDVIEFIWYLLALFGFAAVLYKWRRLPSVGAKLHAPVVAALAVMLIQVALYSHSSIFAASATNDQHRHHAAVNGFLRDEPLGWAEPYYETGNSIADRMYLTYWVLAQALVVEISGVPILLTRYLINPFVMIMSVSAMYVFARNLGHGRKASLVYVILGLLAYSMVSDYSIQAGAQFYFRPLLDKIVAAFALAPVAISCAWLCANTGGRRAYFGFGLSFLATVAVHAIPGGFAAVVVGLFCVIRLLSDRVDWKNSLRLLILLAMLFAPAILVRLNTWESTIYFFDELPEVAGSDIYVYEAVNPLDNGNNFYAIHSTMAGALTYLLVACTALSVAARRLDSRSKLMLAYVIAIGIGLLPYTAWLYGRLVSFYHIVRILWLMPYGYMLGYSLTAMSSLLARSLSANTRILSWLASDRVLCLLLTVALLLTAHFLRFSHGFDLSRDISHAARGDAEWLEIAEYLDANHDERVWIAASPESRSRAITLTWKVVELSRFSAERMSYYSKLPPAQAESQLKDNLRLYSADEPVEEKLAIIDRYGIDYLLFPKGYAWMIDALYQRDKQRFELVYSGEILRLVRVHEMKGDSK